MGAPRVTKNLPKFPHGARKAPVNRNVCPRRAQGAPIGLQEPSDGFKYDPNDTKIDLKPYEKQEHLATEGSRLWQHMLSL